MANTESKTSSEKKRVEIFIPRTPGNTDPNFVIVVNGKNYVLPKGQKSIVPEAVAAEFERSKRAQYKFDNVMFDMSEQSKKQAEEAGIKAGIK